MGYVKGKNLNMKYKLYFTIVVACLDPSSKSFRSRAYKVVKK